MTESIVLIPVAAFLLAFLGGFITRFYAPSRRRQDVLDMAIGVFRDEFEKRPPGGNVTHLEQIGERLDFDTDLRHLWQEFRDTLHAERSELEFDPSGGQKIIRYRQTAPSEAYFSTRALVDVPLSADFWKHLPGILTGLGIIGTFGGLIFGLTDFDVSGSADDVNESVGSLVDTVRTAFFLSGAAIICSIAVTFFEKRRIAFLYGKVQRLQQTIDEMFDSGAGEDYLADIARGSEESATQLKHLREGLVNDLRQAFEDLAASQAESSMAAAQAVSDGIASTLQTPLETMQKTMERTLEDQQSSVQKLMEGSLNAFADRLEEVVGEKLTGAAGHIETAAGSMRDAMGQIDGSVLRIRAILDEVARSAEPLAANAERMNVASDKLANTIEQSSETLDYAIGKFRQLGEEMGKAMAAAEEISRALQHGSAEANQAASALAGTADRLETTQQRIAEVAETLAEVTERNRREGQSYDELIASVERAATQLAEAQREVDDFINGLAGALTETHATFSREINGTLNRTHDEFHSHLATATQTLAATVREFEEFLNSEFHGSVENLSREFARLGNGDGRAAG